jgi:hypothetical protein
MTIYNLGKLLLISIRAFARYKKVFKDNYKKGYQHTDTCTIITHIFN